MIDLYYWTTPNGHKITMFLEEAEMEYRIVPVNIGLGEQFDQSFLEIAPNNRIPAIVDNKPEGDGDPISIFESGAILLYLADKIGQLMPGGIGPRVQTIEWLMWQMAGPGPMLGQVHHFTKFNPDKSPYAQARYLKEGQRLYGVLDRHLQDHQFIVDDYSMVDIAVWPWISRFEWQTINMSDYPNIVRWYTTIAERPAVQSGYQVPKPAGSIPMPAT